MFTRVHTRLLLVLAVLITAGVSFIALNWGRAEKEEREVKRYLPAPEIEPPGLSRHRVSEPSEEEKTPDRVIDVEQEEEDTGRTIELY